MGRGSLLPAAILLSLGMARTASAATPDVVIWSLDLPGEASPEATRLEVHGMLYPARAPAPDLRKSALALHPESLWAVVHDGALMPRGMPRLETFTREQLM